MSVAVIDRLPAVLSVTLNEPVPSVSVPSAGSTAAPSELVKRTMPAYAGSVLSNGSFAVTVTLSATPAVVGLG